MLIVGSKPICEKIKLLVHTNKKQVFCNINIIQFDIQEVNEINLYYNVHVHRMLDYFKNHNSCKIDQKLKNFCNKLNIEQFYGKILVSWEYLEKFFNIIKKYSQKINFLKFDCFTEDYYNSIKKVNEKKCIKFLQSLGMSLNIKENQQLCMGTIAILNEVMEKNRINSNEKIKLIGFTLIKTNSYKSFYHNNSWELELDPDHSFSLDINIILWLHNNDFVDATFCFLQFIDDKLILDTKGLIKQNEDTILELKKIYANIVIKS